MPRLDIFDYTFLRFHIEMNTFQYIALQNASFFYQKMRKVL